MKDPIIFLLELICLLNKRTAYAVRGDLASFVLHSVSTAESKSTYLKDIKRNVCNKIHNLGFRKYSSSSERNVGCAIAIRASARW